MAIDDFIKSLSKKGLLSEDDALWGLADYVAKINNDNYDSFIAICKRNNIVDESFFMKIYSNAPEDVQYKLWKDGYVNSCPAERLIKEIASENLETTDFIKQEFGENLPNTEAYFMGIEQIIVNHISKAKESLKIAMAWFTNPVIFNVLWKACKRGIAVELLINNDSINNRLYGLPFDKLIQEGADLYIAEPPSLIHHKFCIIDDGIIIDGSYNWTIGAENNNDENIVVIKNGKVVETFLNAFDELIDAYKHVDHMPARVPERDVYDCTSYRHINSEEYLIQLPRIKNRRLQREIYKEIFKLLPEETACEKIPSDIYDSIKSEIEEERNRDVNLFNSSINRKSEELRKDLEILERGMSLLTHKVETLEEKKNNSINSYKSKIDEIRTTKQLSLSQKEQRIYELRKSHKATLNKINRTLAKQHLEIEALCSEKHEITDRQVFVNSIRDTALKGNNGLFRINLKWNTEDDLDLHLILPNGTIDTNEDIYYGHLRAEYKKGVCSLDHDAIPTNPGENPQENITWENCLPDGQYRVVVKLYNKKSKNEIIPFSVTAFTGKYAKTEVYEFCNAESKDTIEIATIVFKEGKVVTPITFK